MGPPSFGNPSPLLIRPPTRPSVRSLIKLLLGPQAFYHVFCQVFYHFKFNEHISTITRPVNVRLRKPTTVKFDRLATVRLDMLMKSSMNLFIQRATLWSMKLFLN